MLSAKGIADLRNELAKVIRQGWPDLKQNIPLFIQAFWPFRDELVVDNSIIFKGTKVVIPKSMRTLMLQRIHTSHQGPDACVQRAWDVIFWPGMASEIRHLASQCSTCSNYKAKQQKEPLLSPEIPTTPWTIVTQDLFTFAGKSYLITVDYYSNFWELDAVTDTSIETIIEHTKSHFVRYSIPVKVITENGPQFQAQVYKRLLPNGDSIICNLLTIPQPEQWQGRSNSKNCKKHVEKSDSR